MVNPLRDAFNRDHSYLRISLTEKCNLRCSYCMPEDGVPLTPSSSLLTTAEILRLARLFVQQGITKIRLTGGEPTIRKDLIEIIRGLNALKPLGLKTIGMTTNGLALKRRLSALKDAGMDRLNISLDTLDHHRFIEMTRRNGLESVRSAMLAAVEMKAFKQVKLNVVVMRNTNDDELNAFVGLTKDLPIYVRFIEYMPFGGNQWNENTFISYAEMMQRISSSYPSIDKATDTPNDTSKAYRVKGHRGKFGFISSMSDHFCGTCNRLRLLADGNLKVCLFGNAEINLRDKMRQKVSDDDLIALVSLAGNHKQLLLLFYQVFFLNIFEIFIL